MTKINNLPTVQSTVGALYSVYRRNRRDWRGKRLGMADVGHKCDRFLWLKFRWAFEPKFTDQKLRLFDTGTREEKRVIADLRRAGFEVVNKDPQTNRQFFINLCHIGGAIDGLITGVLEAPKTQHVLEVKSHSKKSFERLEKSGLFRAKAEHWAQCQCYMLQLGLERCLYVAVCKDTDSIWMERVRVDVDAARKLLNRAREVIKLPAPPDRMPSSEHPPCVYVSKDGTRWPCDFYDLCHGTARPERNCRTCVHSTPTSAADPVKGDQPVWKCEAFGGRVLSLQKQRIGCGSQMTIPPVFNAKVIAAGVYQFDSEADQYIEGDKS